MLDIVKFITVFDIPKFNSVGDTDNVGASKITSIAESFAWAL